MTRHLLLTPRGRAQGRWHEAFDDITAVADPASALFLTEDDSVLWVDAEHADWLRSLRAQRPLLPIVAVTLEPTAEEAMALFDAGARGYCHMLAVPEMLRQVATVVSNGGLWLGPDLMNRAAGVVARRVVPQANSADVLAQLTPRERGVAEQVLSGASNKEVARRLDITERTVKAHLGAIFEKLHVRDRLQLVVALRRAGVTPAG